MSFNQIKQVTGQKISGRKQILIGMPTNRQSPPECQDWRINVAKRLGYLEAQPNCKWQFSYVTVGDMLVQASREQMCQFAVEHDFDYIGMWDDDMYGLECMDIWEKLLKDDVDLVAALAFMKNPPHCPVVFANKGGENPLTGEWSHKSHVVWNYPKNTLFECDAVGFGTVLFKVDILRALKPSWFFHLIPNKGEDIHFCHKAKEAGFRIFCDSTIRLKHLAPRQYVGEDEYEAANRDVAEIRAVHGDWDISRSRENMDK